jgi:CubicO group peptidase (beta-lactamase class C family)
LSSERLARFSSLMEQRVKANHFPGAVAAVASNGKIAFFESYGLRDKEAGLAMTDDAIFRIASMTKAITGVAVMMLYEEGRFSLHDPISKYIPSFKESRVLVGGVPVPDKTDKKDWSQADLDQWLKENWESLSDEDKKKWTDYCAANGKGKSKGKSELTETWEDAETVPANRPITIRDLLRHTAGITYNMGDIWTEGDDLGLTFGVRGKLGDRGELGSEGSYYWAGAYGTTFWIDPKENLVGVFMVNGVNKEKNNYRSYEQLLEHFTYQAIID